MELVLSVYKLKQWNCTGSNKRSTSFIIHEMMKKETTTRQLNSSSFVRKNKCEKYSKEYKNLSRNCQYYWYESYKTGADLGKNLTVADFVWPLPPWKIFEIQSILKQYLMHFERIFLSKKDKISVILRYFNKIRLRIYNYNKISHSNKLQRL